MKILTLNKKRITNFAKERNDLLTKSKSDWNLFLDSDESISYYNLERKNYFLNKYVGSDKITRLVKKGTGKWVRAVHEVWEPNKSHSRGGMLNSPIIIHNTADNLASYIIKINNYSTLHARANQDEGKKSSILKIIFLPIAKFILTLIKSKNIVFSIMQSLHSYLSWAKLYLHQF